MATKNNLWNLIAKESTDKISKKKKFVKPMVSKKNSNKFSMASNKKKGFKDELDMNLMPMKTKNLKTKKSKLPKPKKMDWEDEWLE